MSERGAIHSKEAYARAKMLDHSGWNKGEDRLPRNITPSDIDAAIDNSGRILFIEISSSTASWLDLQYGQRILYENLLRSANGKHVAALAKHGVIEEGHPIRTWCDIDVFSLMFYANGKISFSDSFNSDRWPGFVKRWCESNGPDKIVDHLVQIASQRN